MIREVVVFSCNVSSHRLYFLKNTSMHYIQLLEAISKEKMLEHLFEKLPQLKRDVQACAAIRDYVVISWFLTDDKETFVKAHPVSTAFLSQ